MKNKTLMIVLVAALIAFLFSIGMTALNLALVVMAHALHITTAESTWIISAYLLSFASFIIVGGRWGDKYGYKRLTLLGVIIFAVASIFAGIATNFVFLLAALVVLGIGAAIMWPNAVALTNQVSTKANHGFNMSIIFGLASAGLAFGPLLGGFFSHYLSWRWVFFMNVPISLIVIAVTLFFVKNITHVVNDDKFYFKHFVWLAVSVVLISLALSSKTLFSHLTWFIAAIVILAINAIVFLRAQKRSKHPVLNTTLFSSADFNLAMLGRFVMMIIFYGLIFIISIALQKHNHYTADIASLIMLPMTVCMGLLSPLAGKLLDRIGSGMSSAIGFTITTVGVLYLLFTGITLTNVIIGTIIAGSGIGLLMTSTVVLGLQAAPKEHAGIASATLYLVSTLTGSLSLSVLGIIISDFSVVTTYNIVMAASAVVSLIWLATYWAMTTANNRSAMQSSLQLK